MANFDDKKDGLLYIKEEQLTVLIDFEIESYNNNIHSYNNIHSSFISLVTLFGIVLAFLIAFLSIILQNRDVHFWYSIVLSFLIILCFGSVGFCLWFFRTKSYKIKSPFTIFDTIDYDEKTLLIKKYSYYYELNKKYNNINTMKNRWLFLFTIVMYVVIAISSFILIIYLNQLH